MDMRRLVVPLVAVLMLTGCSPAQSPIATPTPTVERAAVQWDDYAPEVRQRIDDATEAGDCTTLNEEFQTAVANNDTVASRTDHNNSDLMEYIDEASDIAGC
jgi:hypothetical protein